MIRTNSTLKVKLKMKVINIHFVNINTQKLNVLVTECNTSSDAIFNRVLHYSMEQLNILRTSHLYLFLDYYMGNLAIASY